MARYQRDGSLDQSFGDGGLVTVVPSWARSMEAYAVTLDGHGRIVVVGIADAFGSGQSVAVARFTGDGRLDGTFGAGGFASPSLVPSPAWATDVYVDPMHGKITVVGIANGQFFVMRLTDDSAAAPFGINGAVLAPPGRPNEQSQADMITVDAYGRLVVAGVTSQ